LRPGSSRPGGLSRIRSVVEKLCSCGMVTSQEPFCTGKGSHMWRQGDVLIAAIPSLPVSKGRRSKNLVLASGDATGHRHRIKDRRSARLYATSSEMFLECWPTRRFWCIQSTTTSRCHTAVIGSGGSRSTANADGRR
jgi:hypothetical protein